MTNKNIDSMSWGRIFSTEARNKSFQSKRSVVDPKPYIEAEFEELPIQLEFDLDNAGAYNFNKGKKNDNKKS